ncbi:GGDEF domain-containing protein [Anaeroselena agilis]|uniref:GGDEF domain-containing protein n=1 Tax=Anaeroselena agilis TaxID=3063788 RepID=A0ABU3P6F3_9FIRM|nr:GGDEF domain-containing protein [Selenomonadales bacterium 4137-cl]
MRFFAHPDTSAGPEAGYREHYLAADARQASVAIAAWLVPLLLFAGGDYFLFGASRQLVVLLTLRLAFAAFSLYTISALAKITTPREYDNILLRWAVFAVIAVLYFNYAWARYIPPNGVLTILIIFSAYMVFPARLPIRLAPPLALSAGNFFLHLWVSEPISPQILFTSLVALAMANTLGIIFSTWLHKHRLTEFQARLEETRVKEELGRLAATDDLTGVLNRRKIMELAAREYERFVRERRPLSVAMIDIDRFKKLNDTYGHEAGDLVLTSFTAYVARQLRREDIWGRLGGDEFVLILPDTPAEQAEAVAERLRVGTEAVVWQDQELPYTISSGIAAAREKDQSVDEVFKRADKALYNAKRRGRNRTEILS